MFSALLLALIVAGQIGLHRAVRPRLERLIGRTLALAVMVGAASALAALLCIIWLDNAWLDTEWLGLARLRQAWPGSGQTGSALSLAAGIWVAGMAGATAALLVLSGLSRKVDHSRRRFLANSARAAAVVVPFGVAGYGTLFVRSAFEVREVDFPTKDLPVGLNGLRIALLTDIHFSPYLSLPELERVIAMANETRPHLALVTGDLITRVGDPLDTCLARLSRLRAEAGVFGSLGNHEIYANCEDYTEIQARRLGIEFLRKRSHLLEFPGGRLNLVGVDYQRQSRPYLVGAGRLIRPGAVNLLMSHNPDVFPVAAELGYDLVVGGHTHGGQVTVEILEQTLNVSRFITPFVAGLYRRGESSLYVSRGIGTINLPMRFGARPEVSLLRLRRV